MGDGWLIIDRPVWVDEFGAFFEEVLVYGEWFTGDYPSSCKLARGNHFEFAVSSFQYLVY